MTQVHEKLQGSSARGFKGFWARLTAFLEALDETEGSVLAKRVERLERFCEHERESRPTP